jgi:signal transduction histidine kinase
MATSAIIALGGAVAYGLMMVLASSRMKDHPNHRLRQWLLATLVVASLTHLSFLLPDQEELLQNLTTDGLHVLGVSLTMLMVSSLTMIYLENRYQLQVFFIGMVWWVGLVATTVTDKAAKLGMPEWIIDTFSPLYVPGLMAIGGWVAIGVVSLLITFYTFSTARLAEIANRAIFWALTLPIALMGGILSATASDTLTELGLILAVVGLLGMTYAAMRLRVLDVRQSIQRTLAISLLMLLSAATILISLLILIYGEVEERNTQLLLAVLLAVIAAVIHLGIFSSLSRLFRRMSGQSGDSISRIHSFTEAISGVVELDELVGVTLDQMRSILQVKSGSLIILHHETEANYYTLTPYHHVGDIPNGSIQIAEASPIMQRLIAQRKPLLQFDIDYAPAFRITIPEERTFFKNQHMAAYAPVVAQGEVIGILCAGNKASDEAYQPQELEVLATIANQVGIALRNARLVDDLRRGQKDASEANRALQAAKEQMEQLDKVKTDFVTIASHELRTPLAQIRGYTDIIQALNEQGMLDPEQLGTMTGNLRKASDRMEELIRNMLDVSQLDVNALDLRFAPVTIANVVKLAIEPLTEAIRDRKQSLAARGLRDLPSIQGDMKRLVQAFNNVIVNAVKFTPDGGLIEITGSLQENPETGDEEIVVAIRDNGIGIDPKNREIIFEKFVRTQDSSLHSTGRTKFMGAGPGLGLTIARGVIDGHGGRIWVESPGNDPKTFPGSTFYIALPLEKSERATGVTLLTFDRSELLAEVAKAQGEGEKT